MRYLWHAFFAKPDVPLLRLPWNALAVGAAAVAGFWDPAIWAIAGAGEFIYLLTMASNAGFQQWVTTEQLEKLRDDTERARRQLLSRIGGAARYRYRKVEEKRTRLDTLYREHLSQDLMADSNRDALRRLTWLHLNLLVAQRALILAPAADERVIQKQIATVEREIASAYSAPIRDAKTATLKLLRDRVDNVRQRAVSLAEIEADLVRIETQIDYALEQASLRGRPIAISANIELTSHLLNNLDAETFESPAMRVPE
jgi:hypothetical protein